MAAKNAEASTWGLVLPSSDGLRYSAYPAGDKPEEGAPYEVDFEGATPEAAISQGGLWTNNTQGTAGNAAMTTQQSLRIAAATSGGINIAQHTTTAVTSYDDCFAFKPGYPGNQRVTATVYVAPGYDPTANHEIELILGCVCFGTGNRRWVECLWSMNGSTDIVLLDGANSGFTIIGNISATGAPQDGDVMIGELNRAARTVKWWRSRASVLTLMVQVDWNTVAGVITSGVKATLDALGNGGGIAAYMNAGDSVPGSIGFRNFRIETI